MSRVIVNIISEQTIPNYLFIKEIFQPGDSLLFIASQKFSERIGWIVQSLGFADISVESDWRNKIHEFIGSACF